MKHLYVHIIIVALTAFCFRGNAQRIFSLYEASEHLPHLYGKKNSGGYLYTTAGDKLYAIGDQEGKFPAVGFHVPGEMGGVWQHPIKLLDGFRLKIKDAPGKEEMLDRCNSFITYPFTTSFFYSHVGRNLSVVRTQFVPDGKPVLVVEYVITNNSDSDETLALEFIADVNLMPVWLGERSGMTDGADEVVGFDKKINTLWVKDKNNSWYAGISSGNRHSDFKGMEKKQYSNKGLAASLVTDVSVAKRKTEIVRFYISGSMKDQNEIEQNIATTTAHLRELFNAKKKRFRQLDLNAEIHVPDSGIMQAYQWGKYSSDWLVRDVPGLGRGMSAGLPDYPWFFSNDQASTFNALVGTIQPDIFYSSWHMIKQVSDKANEGSGRIIHEVSSNGAVYDKGRMEESQLHIITAWNIFRWTGDRAFLKENYEYGKKIWTWLQQHDTDNNGYIEGYGGVEIAGLNEEMLDVQVHTYSFLEAMSRMALVEGDALASADYQSRADKLRNMINRDWWVPEENRYADFISSREKAVEIIDTALTKRVHPGRNEWALQKLTGLRSKIKDGSYTNKGYVVYYNGSGLMPVEEGMADSSTAAAMFKKIYWFTNNYGMYITGIERPDDLSIDEGNFKHDAEFNYNRAVMPAATAGIVIAACRYGYTDTALKYMHVLLNSFNYATPGTMYEVSPDYGMFAQAWNITGFNVPLIQYFFGIDPMAYARQITLHPNFPMHWKEASIRNVVIGDNRFSMQYRRTAVESIYGLTSEKPDWSLKFEVPENSRVKVNGKRVSPENNCITLTGKKNTVSIESVKH